MTNWSNGKIQRNRNVCCLYDVISSGSLLGLYYKDIVSIPVGYEKKIEMFGPDFEEFLWAYGYSESAVEELKTFFASKENIPASINEKFHYKLGGGNIGVSES